jgi:hypothetical protein
MVCKNNGKSLTVSCTNPIKPIASNYSGVQLPRLLLNLVVLLIANQLLAGLAFASEDENKFSSRFENISEQYARDRILEFWGYHDSQGSELYKNTIRLRYYQPLKINRFNGTLRLDTSYVREYGAGIPISSSDRYSESNTMLTFWGNHPNLLPRWGANLGGRIIFPFGNNGQWAIGPQVGASFKPKGNNPLDVTDFSPLARYMYGFDTKSNSFQVNPNQPSLIRNLQLFPTVGFRLSSNTQLRLWDENGVVYNSAGGGWFVPVDAMVTHRVNKHFLFAVGASKQVIQSYLQYDWSVYSKVSFNF